MATKRCENCGREFEPLQSFHRFCPSCFRQMQAGTGGRPGQGSARPPSRGPSRGGGGDRVQAPGAQPLRFDDAYLADGYFLDEEKTKLRPEVIDAWAEGAALTLGRARMTSHQLRLFFNKLLAVEDRLEQATDWQQVSPQVYAFKRDVAYQVGRGVVPDAFKAFIDRNVELAAPDPTDFQHGFVEHFRSVVAYFVYHFRNN